MEKQIFKDFDFSDFWDDNEYALEKYVEEIPSDELILSVEQELGFKLPGSYIEVMKLHNGGIPRRTCFPTPESNSWAADHIAIAGFMGIGRDKMYTLCGEHGNRFRIDEWGYPDTGIYICDCPSGGHDMVMLDYSKCGPEGEPEVYHIDQELDYKKTFLAKDFETFFRGLVDQKVYDTSEAELVHTLQTLKSGRFSDTLEEYFKKDRSVDFDKVLRSLLTELTTKKGYFALHADELSYLAYDIQFYLLSINKKISSKEQFIEEYIPMIAFGNNDITAGGYAEFFMDWFDERVNAGEIRKKWFSGNYRFSHNYQKKLFKEIKPYA